jgi:hypothetical protein
MRYKSATQRQSIRELKLVTQSPIPTFPLREGHQSTALAYRNPLTYLELLKELNLSKKNILPKSSATGGDRGFLPLHPAATISFDKIFYIA